eukprot:CAMPEP_0172772320 /NCGR_PEP_ID=MMETSP1074-20121228/192149_1 /TAXON_ID=2916 /ORGANISM="Ceratium fusus, Strain PA161109" /LENGTH=32 /DNA_ID= /DNA_START= /DNA_END= /DNA_ORIENTATION=
MQLAAISAGSNQLHRSGALAGQGAHLASPGRS